MKSLTQLIPLLLAAFLSSCATSTPVQGYAESQSNFSRPPVLMSHNYPASRIYRLYHRAATGFTPISSLREEIETRAQTFCERQGKGMIVLGERISQPPYILGNFPRIEIVFACVDRKG